MAIVRTQGLVFPLELSSGSHVISEGDDLIKSSIRIILSWPLNTREYRDDFGSRIHEALEDQNDEVLITLIKKFVIDSITKWEKRIKLKKITFERPNNEVLRVDLLYIILGINIEDTFRYTFYTT
jgi:phage baseplate assembly protein W